MKTLATDLPTPDQRVVSPVPSLTIQSVLFRNEPDALFRSLQSIGRATELAITSGVIAWAELAYGDCTPDPIFKPGEIETIAAKEAPHLRVSYIAFRENLGSAAGHNRLLSNSLGELLVIENPDVIPAPDTYTELVKPFGRVGVGMTEARQLPIEHPKIYDTITGETGWAATACAMIPRRLLGALGGFDSQSFFLYCDDVDLSWRVRLAGFKVIYQPSAVVFHHKTLSVAGHWQPTEAEQYYSAEASLFMAHKWSRPDRVKKLLNAFTKSADDNLRKAAGEYKRRVSEGKVCSPIDPHHKVGEFTANHNYTTHRFTL